MTVSMILKQKGSAVYAVAPEQSVSEVSTLLDRQRIGAALVKDARDFVIGVVSERDIVRALARRGGECLDLKVAEVMSSPVVTCSPRDSVNDVMTLMTERRMRHLPVMDDGRLLGVISIGDVVKFRISQVESEADAMRAYIATG